MNIMYIWMDGLVWRNNEDVHCWRVCKSKMVFWTNDIVEENPNLVLHIVFPLKCLWLLLLLWDKNSTVTVLNFMKWCVST